MDHYIRLLHTNQCPTIDDAHIYVRNVMQLSPNVQELRRFKQRLKFELHNKPALCNAIVAAFMHYDVPMPIYYKLMSLAMTVPVWHLLANERMYGTHTGCRFEDIGYLLLVTLHIGYNCYNIYTRSTHPWFNLLTVLFGAVTLMGTKPNDWWLSLQWGCNGVLNERAALLGYTLVVVGTTEFVFWTQDPRDFFSCRGTLAPVNGYILLLAGAALFVSCWVVWLAYQ